MTVPDLLIYAFALSGHIGMLTRISCQMHAAAWHHWAVRVSNTAIGVAGFILPLLVVWGLYPERGALLNREIWTTPALLSAGYVAFACLFGIGPVLWWMLRGIFVRPPAALQSSRADFINMEDDLGGKPVEGAYYQFLTSLPFNQTFDLEVSKKKIALGSLPKSLDGLTITHLTDLHFSGRLKREYFEEIIRHTNELQSDIIAVTGDLVDKSPCIEWLPQTLGQLRAPLGVYFILGNHDLRVDASVVRSTLTDAGLIDMGGRWTVIEARGESILLAGNELPWIQPAADLSNAPPLARDGGPIRLLLAHTPDQFFWARNHGFDLMLAGHNHGGQFQFPPIGPFVAPSRFGVKYASGTFFQQPTVMHVSRGISSLVPLRFNCRPEVTGIELHALANPKRPKRKTKLVHSQRA